MSPKLLPNSALSDLLAAGPVTNITGREPEFHPQGVIDIESYVRTVSPIDLEGATIQEELLVEVAYQTHDGHFDIVNVMTQTRNVYLVVIIDNTTEEIHGHLLLDLNKQYGLDTASDD